MTASTVNDRQLVVIASTMRSGSTLLKALLAEAPDVSNLREVNFQAYRGRRAIAKRIWQLAPQRIVVLKRPAWYHETATYPRFPEIEGCRTILLIRDVYATVESLRKMTFGRWGGTRWPTIDRWLAQRYWLPVTTRLLALANEVHSMEQPASIQLIRYEDLTSNPIDTTRRLFEFVGSARESGTDTYSQPTDRRWHWGRDDASPNIQSLRVQPAREVKPTNKRLLELIETDPAICHLRAALGYLA